MTRHDFLCRGLGLALLLASASLAGLTGAAAGADKVVHVGFQKYGTLVLLKGLGEAVVRKQQEIADTFHALGLIPVPVTVADALYRPGS